MQNRRTFLQQAGALALGSAALSRLPVLDALAKRRKMGLQLFTLFPTFDQDVKGNLQKVAAIGFKEIESAFSLKGGFYGMSAKEFKAILNDLGLQWRSHHVLGAPLKPNPKFDVSKMPKFDTLKNESQKIVDTVAETGVKYLVCASYPHDTLDEVKEGIGVLSKTGEMAKKAGMTLCYHNHDKEFVAIDGQVPYDMLLSQISPDVMKMELDLAWVSKAGIDPVELFKKHPKRFPLWHVKDFDKGFNNLMPVGQGVIDFKRIFAAADTAGMKHFFVEHDMPTDAFASITASHAYLKTLLK